MTPEGGTSTDVWQRVRLGRRRPVAALSAAAVVALAACSSGGTTNTGAGSSSADGGTPQKGGTLNMLGVGDVDYMDPNITYYTTGYEAARLFSRQPYSYSGS